MNEEEKMAIAATLPSWMLEEALRQRLELEAAEYEAGVRVSAPEGCVVHELTSSYYGSHSEYGEGDSQFFVAIPEGTELPQMSVGHGHFSSNTEDLALLPVGSHVNWGGEWESVSSWRRPVPLGEALPIPEGYVAVEATILGDGPDGRHSELGRLNALQDEGREMRPGQTPTVYARSSSHHDVDYIERRDETGHWWEPASAAEEYGSRW